MNDLKPVYYWIELFFTSLIIVTLSISMIFLVAGLSGAITQIVIDRKAMRTWAANWKPPNFDDTILKTTTTSETTTYTVVTSYSASISNTSFLNVTSSKTTIVPNTTVDSAHNSTIQNVPTVSIPIETTIPVRPTFLETAKGSNPASSSATNLATTAKAIHRCYIGVSGKSFCL